MKVRMIGHRLTIGIGVSRHGVVNFKDGVAEIAEHLFDEVGAATRTLGVAIEKVKVKTAEEIAEAKRLAVKAKKDAAKAAKAVAKEKNAKSNIADAAAPFAPPLVAPSDDPSS